MRSDAATQERLDDVSDSVLEAGAEYDGITNTRNEVQEASAVRRVVEGQPTAGLENVFGRISRQDLRRTSHRPRNLTVQGRSDVDRRSRLSLMATGYATATNRKRRDGAEKSGDVFRNLRIHQRPGSTWPEIDLDAHIDD